MSIRLDIVSPDGGASFFESAENLGPRTRHGIEKALWRSGKDLQAIFNRQVLAKDKRGRVYFRRTASGSRRSHTASAPGQTAANITGTYRRGIGFNVDGAHQLRFGNTTEYAGHLELGTSRMRSRPGLRNTVRAGERDIIRNLSTAIEVEL